MATMPPAVTVLPPYVPVTSVRSVQMVQQRLQALGYYHGGIDGIWGAETTGRDHAIPGRARASAERRALNPATVAALGLNPEYLFAAR